MAHHRVQAGDEPVRDDHVFDRFFKSEVSGSVVLLAFTILALLLANSPWSELYFELLHTYAGVTWGDFEFKMTLSHWVADGLMVIFFFVVGLEIKREIVLGQLSSVRQATLPVMAALGGALVPAGIYASLNAGAGGAPHGWGVPMATDIAFALGLLAVFGRRVPIGLKVFLTALAIADDLAAVVVIAVFYTEQVTLGGLVVAGAAMLGIVGLTRLRIRRMSPYVGLCVVAWLGVLGSGVHATIAGVALAMLVPVSASIEPGDFLRKVRASLEQLEDAEELTRTSPAQRHDQMEALDDIYVVTADMRPAGIAFEHHLQPIQAFLILPLFALFMAGVPISGDSLAELTGPVGLGIILGLVVGKQVGITFFAALAVRFGGSELPEGVTWTMIWAVSCLGGVGFTMAIFIGDLAFSEPDVVAQAKLAILVASVVAAVIGLVALGRVLPGQTDTAPPAG